jgi:hypothetical protein
LDQKLQFTYPYASIKSVQVTEKAFSSQKRISSTSKHEFPYFFYFCASFFPLLDPDPLTQLNPDPMRIRIRFHNPGLHPSACKNLRFLSLLSVMTISVLNIRHHRSNATSFPESNYERPYGTIEDRVLLGRAALEPHATEDGIVKAVFFSFKHLDEILSLSFQPPLASGSDRRRSGFPNRVLNSRIISAAVVPRDEESGEAAQASPAAAQVVLRHLREDTGLAAPTCVIWDTVAAAWQEAGCRLIAARSRDTVCECHMIHGGSAMMHVGLLMEEVGEGGGEGGGLVTTVVQLPAFHVEIIVASVAAGILLICLLLLLKVSLKVE